ncbi:MAG: hypothetical protein P1Q69_03125 [Candidatus Thorarchaeota archaeon]|nr:hypothetical protein [Candidatus Thorarchaeota archaeon]
MAHEGFAVTLIALGVVLLLGYFLGPKNEVRKVKRMEGLVMLIPTGVLLIIIALIVLSGILDVPS